MPSKFPGPYVNSTEQNDSIMHYVRGGQFSNTDIGARKSGMVSGIKNEMSVEHVGDATPNPAKTKF